MGSTMSLQNYFYSVKAFQILLLFLFYKYYLVYFLLKLNLLTFYEFVISIYLHFPILHMQFEQC